MALSHAERQRRYRERKAAEQAKRAGSGAGDGSPDVTSDATTDGDPRQPRYLRARGRRLWTDLATQSSGPAETALIEEACRLVDRLDKLDAILGGRDKAWITIEIPDDGGTAEVIVDKVLSEARQQQIALKQLLAEIRAFRKDAAAPPAKPQPAVQPGGAGVPAGVGDLTARIAARSAQTAR